MDVFAGESETRMISIINVGNDHPSNKSQYNVKVDKLIIATFFHKPSDGLEACLYQAYLAVQRKNIKDHFGMEGSRSKKIDVRKRDRR